MSRLIFAFLLLVALSASEIFFQEEFGEGWENRWVVSKNKQSEGTAGEFAVSAGKYFRDEVADRGLKTTEDARFYQISAELPEFSNKGKDLVVQFSVKHEQFIDCGGGYIKLLPSGLDQENFSGESPYNIMFGPDICGGTKRVHAIITYKGKNYLIKKDIPCTSDDLSHLYTFVLKSDQTFKVLIDNEVKREGSLAEEWDILPPKMIKDPEAKKPSDWVNDKEIPDTSVVKPEDWDSIPAEIPDASAEKPEDWDDELDGEWEPPTIPNPEYKGEWKAPMIKNPDYTGEWVHPKIANPDYFEDDSIYAFESNKYVGFELWQVKSGTIFDNILVTDSLETAEEWAKKTLDLIQVEKDLKKAATPSDDDYEDEDEEDMGGMEGMEGMEGMDDFDEEFEGMGEDHEEL